MIRTILSELDDTKETLVFRGLVRGYDHRIFMKLVRTLSKIRVKKSLKARQGAIVQEPFNWSHRYNNSSPYDIDIFTLDYGSLYPSIIGMYPISYTCRCEFVNSSQVKLLNKLYGCECFTAFDKRSSVDHHEESSFSKEEDVFINDTLIYDLSSYIQTIEKIVKHKPTMTNESIRIEMCALEYTQLLMEKFPIVMWHMFDYNNQIEIPRKYLFTLDLYIQHEGAYFKPSVTLITPLQFRDLRNLLGERTAHFLEDGSLLVSGTPLFNQNSILPRTMGSDQFKIDSEHVPEFLEWLIEIFPQPVPNPSECKIKLTRLLQQFYGAAVHKKIITCSDPISIVELFQSVGAECHFHHSINQLYVPDMVDIYLKLRKDWLWEQRFELVTNNTILFPELIEDILDYLE